MTRSRRRPGANAVHGGPATESGPQTECPHNAVLALMATSDVGRTLKKIKNFPELLELTPPRPFSNPRRVDTNDDFGRELKPALHLRRRR